MLANRNVLLEIGKRKADLKIELVVGNGNSNPLTAIAEVFGIKGSDIISIFIPLLVFILEPLAIGLTIAANSAWMNHGKNKNPIPQINSQDTKNLTEKLHSLQKKHNLSVSQIAKITGRKKLTTCDNWLKGTIPTPPRALARIQAWVENEFIKPDG